MSSEKKLLKSINLQVEENKTITEVEGGIKTTVICNKKHMMTGITNVAQLSMGNRSQAIIFNTHSKSKDCSYLMLEKYMHKALSSKISFVVSKLLHLLQTPELYNQVKSQELRQLIYKLIEKELLKFDGGTENNLADKWSKIIENISEKSIQDVFISLKHKIDHIYVEDEKMIEYYRKTEKIVDNEKCSFAYLVSYLGVEFPLYNADTSKNKLLGVSLEKNEVEVLKKIFQYIFKDIDKKNAYSSLDNTLLKDKPKQDGDKVYIVDRIHDVATPTMMLIEAFNLLATHIDRILDSITELDDTIENEKFNLNLTKEEMEELRSFNTFDPQYYYYGSSQDYTSEIKSNPSVNFDDFNKRLNDVALKPIQKVVETQRKEPRRTTYIGSGKSSFISLSLPASQMIDSFNVLDPDDASFEKIIPSEERKRNTHIIANSGAGKTTMLKTFISKDLKEGHTVIVMDPDGEFAEQVAKMVDDPSKLVYIDPYIKKGKTPTINPFQVAHNNDERIISQMTQELMVAFEHGIGLEWTVNMEAVLYPCISTLIRKGDSDLRDLQRFMNKKHNQDLVALGKKSPIKAHRDFFKMQFQEEKLDTTRDAIETKLQILLNDLVFANLITGESTINLEKEINTKGKVIIFKLSVGEMPTTLTLFSRLIMAMIQGIIFRRGKSSQNKGHDTHLYLDEFQHFVSPSIETMLTQSRKKKCYTTLAHQTMSGQLSVKMKDIVGSCTHYKLVGQNSYDNHKIMSKELQCKIEDLQNLQNGCFLSKVKANPNYKVKYSEKYIGDNASVMDDEKWEECLDEQIEKYCRSIEDESLWGDIIDVEVAESDIITLEAPSEKPKYDEF